MKKLTTCLTALAVSILPLLSQTSGGPDPYGYTWKNVDHTTSPPVFKWIDIIGKGTQVTGLTDDNYVGPFTASNGFQFYWYNTPEFYVGSNGFVSFAGDNIASPFPASIPLSSGYNDWLAVFLSDLNFSGSGNQAQCYYWSNTDTLIVSFIEVPFWIVTGNHQTGSNTFQIIMDKNDYSITYNYLETDIGAKTSLDNIIGMENVTGTLGLASLIDSLPRDSFAIKFYYPPSTSYQAIDGGMNWNYNTKNGGVFVNADGPNIPLVANVKNFGNTTISGFTVYDTVLDASSNVVTDGSANVGTIGAGNDQLVNLPDSFSTSNTGTYRYRTHLSGISGDLVASNNALEQEIVVVDSTSSNMWLEYSDQSPDGSGLGWNGGDGGIAIYIEPPIYPAKVNRMRFFMNANATPPVGFHAMIYDDDGPNGGHGTLLDSVFVSGSSITLNQYEYVVPSQDVVIDSGGVYLFWNMDGAGIDLARDLTPPFSRRTFEILGQGWSGYRRMLTEDFLMGLRVSYAYPEADFAFTIANDPEIDFFDLSQRDPTSWYWEFGDGDTSTQQNPVHTYDMNRSYDVCLTASNQYGSDSICKKVTVEGIPAVAKFVYDDSAIPVVHFTDSSTGSPTSWTWDFDDGGGTDTSSLQNPTYTYKNKGQHIVCLTVSNANGVSQPYCDTISFTVGINKYEGREIKVYPNPMEQSAVIVLPENIISNEVNVVMTNVTGAEFPVEASPKGSKITIQRGTLTPGTYILQLFHNGNALANIPIQVQ